MEERFIMNKGRITQVIGPVVDVEFEAGKLPEIYPWFLKLPSIWVKIRYEPSPWTLLTV
jgi:hypothetical protein